MQFVKVMNLAVGLQLLSYMLKELLHPSPCLLYSSSASVFEASLLTKLLPAHWC